ncbi:MAG: hypothetical protein IPM23_10600 [Candidatus Melainabacteria bacterium]|nr:hypothetical protein [Candidatus Melainabacteria bacterium]
MYLRRNRKKKGGALVETVTGLFILVPIVLFLVDVVAMVMAQTANDALAKDCARAAASAPDAAQASAAVAGIVASFNSPVLSNVSATITNYNTGSTVTVQTQVTFTFPVQVPFVGVSSQDFAATATEPVVGVLPT